MLRKKQKPALILIHGFRGSHHGLLEIVEFLNDYELYVPDIPGSGVSPELDDKSLDGYAEWLHNYIKAKKLKKPYIVGHSMGSIIVSHFVAKYPDDVARKVVLLSPIFRTTKGQKKSTRAYKLSHSGLKILSKKQQKNLLASKPLSYIISHMLTYDKGQQKRIDELHYQYSGKFASADSFIADMQISMCNQTTLPKTSELLLCAGTYDQLTDINLTRETARKNHIKFTEIKETGHLLNYEKPRQVAKAIKDFIES